jgi:hypothetical protein
MASNDFQTRVIRTNQIIYSGSSNSKPLLVYGTGSAIDNIGGILSAHFTTGSDTWLFISGSKSSKGTSTRGVATFGGDVVISGTIYDINGNAYSTAGSTPGGLDTQVQFNDGGSTFGGNSNFTFNKTTGNTAIGGTLTLGGDLGVNGGDITSTSTTATIFSTNVTSLSLANVASTVTVGGSSSSATAFTFNLATNRINNSTLNLGTGATGLGSTKTLNIGVGGLQGSTTIINLGNVNTTGSATINMSGSFNVTGTMTMSGSIIPSADTAYTLGTATKRWAHVYTGDLHLRNDRGDWTIIEENDYLRIKNNKNGKNFKIVMQEIDYIDT